MPQIDFSNPAYHTTPVLPSAQNSSPGQGTQIDFSKYMTGSNAATQSVLPPANTSSTFAGGIEKAGSDIASTVGDIFSGKTAKQDIPNTLSPTLPQEMQAGADVAGVATGGVGKVAGDLAGAVGSLIPTSENTNMLPALKTADGSTPTNLTDAFTAMMQGLGKTPPAEYVAQKIGEFQQKHPLASKDLGDLINITSVIPEEGVVEGIGEGAVNAGKNVGSKIGDVVDSVKNAPGDGLVEKAQIASTKSNMNPALGTAAKRVQEVPPEKILNAASDPKGLANLNIERPSALHEKYYNQELKFLKDNKEDTAIGMVGTDIGNAFGNVVKMRQKVGKTISDELDKFGSTKISNSGTVSAFQQDLIKSGAKYDSLEKTITNSDESKFTSSDTKLLEKYGQEMQKLGSKPTAKALDAFVGRMPNEIKALKAEAGINFKTNAERIISKNLDHVRSTLTNAGTPAYKSARSSYSELSKVVDEGAPMLGKITQSGDFAKDASLAKSAVKSISDNGKKDWLLKIEKITGEPLLDKATLALQAMKDAGDYRGNSLLEDLTNTVEQGKALPFKASEVADLVAGSPMRVVSAGVKKFKGTPFEQTQRYLKSIEK